MQNDIVNSLANSYNEKYWADFANSFPSFNNEFEIFIDIPDDILQALAGVLGPEAMGCWLNTEVNLLNNIKPIDLLKSERGTQALKMFILSMPN